MATIRRNKGGVIAVRTRLVVLGLVAVGLIFALTACMGFWNTPQQLASLIFGPLAVSGGRGEFVISVTDMPDGGLASISVETDAGYYAGMKNVAVEGLSGFTILASQFDDATGTAKFVAARTSGGAEGGTVVKIAFEVDGTPAIDVANKIGTVVLGSDFNTLITGYQTVTGKDYYTK